MKNTYLFLPLFLMCFLYACEPFKPIEKSETKTIRMGFKSIISYKYMQYTGDSALLNIRAEERDSISDHYNHAEIIIGEQTIAVSETLPVEVEIPIPLIEDSVILVQHICWKDTLDTVMYRDMLFHAVQVHKGEITNQNPEEKSFFYNLFVGTKITIK